MSVQNKLFLFYVKMDHGLLLFKANEKLCSVATDCPWCRSTASCDPTCLPYISYANKLIAVTAEYMIN